MKEVYTKLAAVQGALFCPKGQRNNFGGYNYRSCEDILKAVKPLLAEHGLALYLSSDTMQVGPSIYVNVRATIADTATGQTVEVCAQAREPDSRKGMDAAQVSGSSLSYARKYALAGLLGIDNEKDPDATNDHGGAQATQPQAAPQQAKPAPRKPSETAPRAKIDYTVCPCGGANTKLRKWTDIDTTTLNKILACDPARVPLIREEHRALIIAELAKRKEAEFKDI